MLEQMPLVMCVRPELSHKPWEALPCVVRCRCYGVDGSYGDCPREPRGIVFPN